MITLKSQGNYFSVDVEGGSYYHDHKNRFIFTQSQEGATTFYAKYRGVPITINESHEIEWDEFDNEGTPFDTIADFKSFVFANTGFNWGVTAPTIDYINAIMSQIPEEPVGVVEFFAGATAPSGYLLCNGAEVSRATYVSLFSVIGVVYGTGNGTTTFNLPNLKQRFPLAKSDSGTGAVLGETGGSIDHVHTVDPPNTTTGAPSGTSGQLVGVVNVASSSHTHDINIPQFNSGTSNPPYLVLNAIIKY